MPRRHGGTTTEEVGYHLPGLYARLLADERRVHRQPDPRAWALDWSRPEHLVPHNRDGLGVPVADLVAGRPVTVGRGRIITPELRRDVPMFADPTNTWFLVTKNDRVTVAATDFGSGV